MNERIKELVAQASYKIIETNEAPIITQEFDKELFAQLIVRECAEVCLAQRDPANLNYKPSEKFAEAVKEHFGVKQ
jgi:hypothetical protein